MVMEIFSKSSFDSLNFNDDDDDNDEGNIDVEDIPVEIFSEAEELAAGFYFSVPDIGLSDLDDQLTEPLCPPMSDHDFLGYYSLDPPSVSGLVLVPKHTPHSPQIEYVSLTQTQTKVPDFSFLYNQNLQIIQSCNGLFLCFSQSSQLYYICNLTSQHPEAIPSSASMTSNFSLNLAFDPYASPYYKVLCVQKLEHRKLLHQICIYSSETRSWTTPGESFIAPKDIDFSDGVLCNGMIHWMRRTTNGLYFSLKEEVLREMPKLPLKEGYSLVSCEYFGESLGYLYLVTASSELPFLELFEMKEDYSGWFQRGVIDLKALAIDFPIMGRRSNNPHPYFPCFECDVLSVVQGCDNDEDLQVTLSIPGEVITYNHEKRFAKRLCDLRIRPDDRVLWYRVYSSYQLL